MPYLGLVHRHLVSHSHFEKPPGVIADILTSRRILMPDSPMAAKFLKGDDKLVAIERLRMNQQGIGSGVWKWEHVWEAILDAKTWLWFILMFIIS